MTKVCASVTYVPSLTVEQVDKASCCADYVEFIFQDQYFFRTSIWEETICGV